MVADVGDEAGLCVYAGLIHSKPLLPWAGSDFVPIMKLLPVLRFKIRSRKPSPHIGVDLTTVGVIKEGL